MTISISSKFTRAPAALLIALALSACGGGGSSPSAQVPVPSAAADTASAELNKPVTLAVMNNDSVTANGKLKLVSATAPAHGTAVISGAAIVYTPAPGFFGKDSFSYTVKDEGTGAASAGAEVTLNVAAKLTLNGKFTDIGPAAAVTVAVGGATVNATTDASGNFSAPVTLDTPAAMITITAQGTGARAFVKMISLAGDSQLAVTAAGGGTTLTPAQLPGLKVSSFTTALYANAVRKNGGAVPATQAALDTAAANTSWTEYAQVAAHMRLLTGKAGGAPRRPLPAGAADTLALVLNTALYTEFVKQLQTDDYQPVSYAMAEEQELGSVPSLIVDKSRTLVFFNNVKCCAGSAPEIILNPNGTGSYSFDDTRHAGTWRKDDALTFTLYTPAVRDDTIENENGEFRVQYITRQIKILQTTGAAGGGFVNWRRVETLHYVNHEFPDAPVVGTSEPYLFTEWEPLAAPSDLAGVTLAGLVNRGPAGPIQITVAFGADGSASSAQLPGVAISWKIQDGKLVVDYGNGQVHTLASIRRAADGVEQWLLRTPIDGDYAVQEAMIVRAQPGLAFTAAIAVQHWRSNPDWLFIGSRTNLVVAADFLVGEDAQAANGTLSSLRISSWAIENGKLAMRVFRKADGQLAPVCPSGETCTLSRERIWTLIRDDATTITVLEHLKTSPASPGRVRLVRYSRN